ncbi:DUF2520 domain-containing protein [Rothia sp. AR01]|uniref:DUF2520 domain-containing protein n=1 Tax=Rothia santali TaxID=2949643 RepID=A0A9X2HCW5_9MICC|nr:DUF2520 domain-containing protein [Rothia santali]MCP3427319.1 DUF2520 domain-containing protein [Rothia santali]
MSDPSLRPGRLGVGVIGAGKVGAVLGAALRAAGHAVVGVHAVSEESRTRAEALLPDIPVLPVPQIVERSEVVLLAVPDDALEPLVTGLSAGGHFSAGQILIHTSGRYGIEVLRAARADGAIGIAMHPAMTFTGLSLDLARLQSATFGITAPGPFLPIAQALAVEMGGEPVVIAEGDRPLYHAALSHASNHMVTLIGQASQILEGIGVEDPAHVLGPLLKATLDNALASGDAALTGPVVRGDAGTVGAHREILAGFAAEEGAPDVDDAYLAMARATADRARSRGALSEEGHARVLRALDLERGPEDEAEGGGQ